MQPVTQQPVQTESGRIIYNHQYESTPKGSHSGSTHIVKKGGALFYTVRITGNDFHNLTQRNNTQAPYALNTSQILQVSNVSGMPIADGDVTTQADAVEQGVVVKPAQNSTVVVVSQPTITHSESSSKQNANEVLPNSKPTVATVIVLITVPIASTTEPIASNTSTSTPISTWRRLTEGRVIETFGVPERGNKGIDIAGSRGQATIATADDRVVYAGNVLRGYGNLITIKHNDDYLSAYAHNNTMLVREQQEAKAGQKIVTVGSTRVSPACLHFETRYKGKPVDPLRYLPQR